MSAEDKPIVTGGDDAVTTVPASGYDNVSPQEVAEMSVRRVRITYAALLALGFILGVLAKEEMFEWLAGWAIKKGCEAPGQGTIDNCVGAQSCYRIAFAMFLFFFIHWALSSPWNLCLSAEGRVKFNQAGIFVKLLSLIPLFLVSFAIPNNFFIVFGWFSMIVSALFLVAQLVILLDFSYAWSADWVDREESKFQTGLLVCTVAMFLGAITFITLTFVYFGQGDCQLNQAMASVTLVCGFLYTGLSIVALRGSLLPSATVFIYTAYTCFTALMLGPPGECNRMDSSGLTAVIIGTVFSALSLVYMTVSAGTSRSAFQLDADDTETVEEAEASSFAFFHVMMMMGSCYLAMLLTNWTIVGSNDLKTISPGNQDAPLWAKLVSEFVCILLYSWSLIAPMIFTDRDFGA